MRRKDRQVSDFNEVLAIIQKGKTCRLAMLDGNRPYIVPLNYGFEASDGKPSTLVFWFHCAKEGHKLDLLRQNPDVCFELDIEGNLEDVSNPCNSGYFYESVIGYGRIVFVEDQAEASRGLAILVKHQTGKDFSFNEAQTRSVQVLRLDCNEFTAKRKARPAG